MGVVLVLTGAGTMATYELSIPPFQTTPAGVVRVRPGIPVEYTDSLGRHVECLAFLEFMNIDDNQYQRLAAIRDSAIWVGWGDRTLRELGLTDASPEQQFIAVSEATRKEAVRQAAAVIPGLGIMSEILADPDRPVDAGPVEGPVYTGHAMSCSESGDVDE